jgi:lysophospholipase L1-like esterase
MYGDNTQLGESVVDGRRMIVRANVPALLSARFCEVFGGSVLVENHGVSGIKTKDIVDGHNGVSMDWKSEMSSSDADIVVINTGANDASDAKPNFGDIYEDWISIIRTAQSLGKIVVVEAANPLDNGHNVDLWSVVHAQHGAADVNHAIFVDQYALVSKVPGWNRLLADKVNPGERLYRLKASILFDALSPTVKTLVTERLQDRAK